MSEKVQTTARNGRDRPHYRRRKIAASAAVLMVANLAIGVPAILPLTGMLSLLAHWLSGPYPPATNHTGAEIAGREAPFPIDGDEVGIVAVVVLFAAIMIAGAFAGMNTLIGDRIRPGLPWRAVWILAGIFVLLPWLFVMTDWWFDGVLG